jgi:hypothetical protein
MRLTVAWLVGATILSAQPFQAKSLSSISVAGNKVEIVNVAYEVVTMQRLLLRKTTSSKVVLDEPGTVATTKLEAWPLGTSLTRKPLFTIQASGTDGRTVEGSLFVIDRGLEEVQWWSVYQLRTGRHLFDTYVPLVGFSISRETVDLRYLGLEIPPDDSPDPRLKQKNVVGVVTYASANGVLHEALLACDDAKQAQLLRSYADSTRSLALTDEIPPRAFKILISQNAPSPANTIILTIPFAADDLDLAHAKLPAGLHLTRWKQR